MRLSHIARGALAAENGRRYMMLRGRTPNGHPLWDGDETKALVDRHPDYDAAIAINKRRTRVAHYGKAGRLGITRPRASKWSENEILRLHRLFAKATKLELLSALPGRSWGAICRRAWADGYHRPDRLPKPTGCYMLDQILQRARDRGFSLADLDGLLRAKRYFSSRAWRSGRFNHSLHCRAVVVLGGTVRARWPK